MYIKKSLLAFSLACSLLLAINNSVSGQTETKKKRKTGSIYFSWGYNTEWYTPSTVHIDQPSLGNKYDLVQVNAHDHKGWDMNLLHQQPSIPQYNYRLGYYFNKKQDLAFEINFDHTKYIISDGQYIQVKGTMHNAPYYNPGILFSEQNGFYYYLNNGANFLLFNIVKRIGLYADKTNKFRVDLTGKAGIGPVIPHVQNSFFGKANDPRFQLGGWNTGIETVVRATFMRYVYLELSDKIDYARYSHLEIYEGTAHQDFATCEFVLSLGVTLPTTKHNPLFAHSGSVSELQSK
jgi:hypothetical protein